MLPAGHAQSGEPVGPKITLHFPHLFVSNFILFYFLLIYFFYLFIFFFLQKSEEMNTSKNGFNKIDESVHSEMFDSATTRSVGRGLCLNAWPLAERAPRIH